MEQCARYQLEISHGQQICFRSSKREREAFKYYIIKEKTMAWALESSYERCYRKANGRKERKRKVTYHDAKRYQSQ